MKRANGVQDEAEDGPQRLRSKLSSLGDPVVFNDPIHGHIELDPLCARVIDTPQFQRLRRLKQLGATYWVFPGATHNRFEHCIGVCHIAGELVDSLRRRQPELGITDEDVLCVKLAGLCHDLGHGPFSHTFDGKFIPAVAPQEKWHHEDASITMFRHLLDANELHSAFAERGLTAQDVTFIVEQIHGPLKGDPDVVDDQAWRYEGRPRDKSFLYEIVANKRNGIDVDKWDYFSRDAASLGISNSFDYKRLMMFLKVIDVDGALQICPRDKEASSLYDMFHTRNSLHRRAYQHKTANIIDHMITEALIAANDHIRLPGTGGRLVRMSEAIHDMEAYTRLTDDILSVIALSSDPNLREAQRILDAIEHRKVYKFVDQTQPTQQRIAEGRYFKRRDAGDIAEQVMRLVEDSATAVPLTADSIVVNVVTMDYGAKHDNPMENVNFWSKHFPDKAGKIRKNQVSQMLPERFQDQYIRVYCKDRSPAAVEAVRRALRRWCAAESCVDPKKSSASARVPNSSTSSPAP